MDELPPLEDLGTLVESSDIEEISGSAEEGSEHEEGGSGSAEDDSGHEEGSSGSIEEGSEHKSDAGDEATQIHGLTEEREPDAAESAVEAPIQG